MRRTAYTHLSTPTFSVRGHCRRSSCPPSFFQLSMHSGCRVHGYSPTTHVAYFGQERTTTRSAAARRATSRAACGQTRLSAEASCRRPGVGPRRRGSSRSRIGMQRSAASPGSILLIPRPRCVVWRGRVRKHGIPQQYVVPDHGHVPAVGGGVASDRFIERVAVAGRSHNDVAAAGDYPGLGDTVSGGRWWHDIRAGSHQQSGIQDPH